MYKAVAVKPATHKRFVQFALKLSARSKTRVTMDEALNALLDLTSDAKDRTP